MGDESAGDESTGEESAGEESAGDESATIYPHLLKNVSFFINFIVCQFYLLNADKMAVLPPSLMVLFLVWLGCPAGADGRRSAGPVVRRTVRSR